RINAYKPVHHPDFMYGDIILFLSLAENGKIWGMNEIMGAYRKHEGGITHNTKSIVFIKRHIKHHEAIQNCFNKKYCCIENEILCKKYIRLAKLQFLILNLHFIKSLVKAFSYNPNTFFINIMGIKR